MRPYKRISAIGTPCVASAIAAAWVSGMFYVSHFLSEPVRPGTVISVLFLIVLFSANYWGLVPSLAASLTAALCFVTCFQPSEPPLETQYQLLDHFRLHDGVQSQFAAT